MASLPLWCAVCTSVSARLRVCIALCQTVLSNYYKYINTNGRLKLKENWKREVLRIQIPEKSQSANCNNYYFKRNKRDFFCCFIFTSSRIQLFFLNGYTIIKIKIHGWMQHVLVSFYIKLLFHPNHGDCLSKWVHWYCDKSRKLALFVSKKKCFQWKSSITFVNVILGPGWY